MLGTEALESAAFGARQWQGGVIEEEGCGLFRSWLLIAMNDAGTLSHQYEIIQITSFVDSIDEIAG